MFAVLFRTCLLAIFCVSSDYLADAISSTNYFVKSLLDSSIHGIVGALSWYVIFSKPFVEIIICGIISSVLDIDHFVAAKSLSLKAALSLPHRPIFHAVIAIPIAALFLWSFARFCIHAISDTTYLQEESLLKQVLAVLPYMLIVGWSSHQLRDSIRRGLWLWPFGSLPKTPYFLYIILVCAIPTVINLFFVTSDKSTDSDTNILEVFALTVGSKKFLTAFMLLKRRLRNFVLSAQQKSF